MTPSLALQSLIGSRLAADPALLALVPAGNIVDASDRPSVFPAVFIGEGQEAPADEVARRYLDAFSTLHVWTKEPGHVAAKSIAGAIRRALKPRPWHVPGYHVHDLRFEGARFLRDPKGELAHGVVTIAALMEELA